MTKTYIEEKPNNTGGRWYVPVMMLGLVVLVACTVKESFISPSGSTEDYFRSREVERRVDSLMRLLTLEEKIGQLCMYTSHHDVTGPSTPIYTEELIREGKVGAMFNAFTASHNAHLQRIAVEESPRGIPILFGYDVIHGFKTIFPINLAMSCSWDTILVEQVARVSAMEATASGVKWAFSPMCDISRDPRWGRVSEGSGEDYLLCGKMGAAMVRGYQGEDMSSDTSLVACVKHFAGYGAVQAGRDYHTVDITDRTLRGVYLPAYKAALDAGAGSVMTAFNEVDGCPATASYYLMTDILRDQWGFGGLVVSDYTAVMELLHHGTATDSLSATAQAVNAGVNIDMESDFYRQYLRRAVEYGYVSEKQVDRMCRDVLRIKFYAGLFDNPYQNTDVTREKTAHQKDSYMQLSRRVARESCVLLENEGMALPLDTALNIAVIGPLADSRDDLLGSWRAAGDTLGMLSILDAMKERFPHISYAKGCPMMEDDTTGFARAREIATTADVVLMVCGESWQWTGEAASVTDISLPSIQDKLLQVVRGVNRNVVMILLNGRPLELTDVIPYTNAILEAWYPGSNGARGVVDIISGDYNPSGRLTMSFPMRVGQVPVHYDMKNTGRPYTPDNPRQKYLSRYLFTPNSPLYPFGYGLSYTSYEYSDVSVEEDHYLTGEPIRITAKVKNTGAVAGWETAQLYVRDVIGSVTRPVRELKAWQKVYLAPGEEREILFTLTEKDLSFYRADMTWGIEEGRYDVWVGGDSNASEGDYFYIKE